jgi:16S rRNA (guanine527-N7)-methyltransferase
VGEHGPPLRAAGFAPAEVEALATYLDLLAEWSRRVNLTAAASGAERVRILVEAVRPAANLLEPGRLLDVGSGNGSPGLVLALLRSELPAVLLEPRQKRWAFLREAVRRTGRPNIDVLRLRHDQYEGPGARNVTVRAVGLPGKALAPLVEPGGQLVVFGELPPGVGGGELVAGERLPGPQGAIQVYRRRVPQGT